MNVFSSAHCDLTRNLWLSRNEITNFLKVYDVLKEEFFLVKSPSVVLDLDFSHLTSLDILYALSIKLVLSKSRRASKSQWPPYCWLPFDNLWGNKENADQSEKKSGKINGKRPLFWLCEKVPGNAIKTNWIDHFTFSRCCSSPTTGSKNGWKSFGFASSSLLWYKLGESGPQRYHLLSQSTGGRSPRGQTRM